MSLSSKTGASPVPSSVPCSIPSKKCVTSTFNASAIAQSREALTRRGRCYLSKQVKFHREVPHDWCLPPDGQASPDGFPSFPYILYCCRHVIHMIVSVDPSRYRQPDQLELRIPVLAGDRVTVSHQGAYLGTADAAFEVYLNS